MTTAPLPRSRLARLTLGTIGYNILVILWGAWVRLSGSGAGCGRHWPLCDGQLLPSSGNTALLIEFAHRASSSIALFLVVGMVVLARRDFTAGHPARRWAWISLAFIVLEALIGAALVLFEYVEDNASIWRAVWLGGHLLNTLLMLGAFAGTRWAAMGHPIPGIGTLRRTAPALLVGLAAILLTGMSGAIASLGDMLYPSATLREGLAADFAADAPLLIRLRLWHPVIAIATGLVWLTLAQTVAATTPGNVRLRQAARTVTALVLLQWVLGASALLLLIPVPLQLAHLLVADLLWLGALGVVVMGYGGEGRR